MLGYNNTDEAVLVGVGSLGRALMAYSGFEVYGLKIVAAFDTDENLVGSEVSGKKIIHASRISDMCRRMNVHIGIITVPARTDGVRPVGGRWCKGYMEFRTSAFIRAGQHTGTKRKHGGLACFAVTSSEGTNEGIRV